MGLMIDTNVFIQLEKKKLPLDFSAWDKGELVCISVITASELLMGVHRADTEARRQRRSAFVETILASIGIVDVTLPVARLHAQIGAELMKSGQLIGAHDLIIAASAKYHDLSLLTDNVKEFSRVPGVHVIPFTQLNP